MTNQMLQNIAQKGEELSVQQPEVTPEVGARSFNISEDNITLLEGDGGELFAQVEESEIFELSFSDSGTVLVPTQIQTDELEVLEVAKRDQDSVNTDTTTENTTEVVVMD